MCRAKAPRPLLSGCVERISENGPHPIPERPLEAFSFVMQGFHSDNRVAYVDYQVAALLENLRTAEFAKSRPRRSYDNGLAKSWNGSVIRQVIGH